MKNGQLVKENVFIGIKTCNEKHINEVLGKSLETLNKKIVVLDDDPTGVQTVHDISVYTDWSEESIEAGFREENSMFYILTNSRGFTAEETKSAHEEIAKNILAVSGKLNKDCIIVSRCDSTLRGHYPLETEVLKETIESSSDIRFDGEVLLPFFKEGGRFTISNIHYVQEGEFLTPAGETEFAKDKTFGYRSSDLREYIEEKTDGRYKTENVTCISLESLRNYDIFGIGSQLEKVSNFGKVVVNAIDYCDVKVFCIALIKVIEKGKRFIFRSGSALTKVLGGVSDRGLLTRDELIKGDGKTGGLIIVGSHVQKTTEQLEELKSCSFVRFIEFNQHLVLMPGEIEKEVDRVVSAVQENISEGITMAVYTRRDRLDLGSGDKKEELKIAVRISDAVTSIVKELEVRPNYIVAKGGITSSDIGTKGLNVKKALVAGQILPGIPVWLTGNESKFPGLPYIIFPGNVGTRTALKEVVEILDKK